MLKEELLKTVDHIESSEDPAVFESNAEGRVLFDGSGVILP